MLVTQATVQLVGYVVVQFYLFLFEFYFLLFQTHYHSLPYPKAKKKKFNPQG